MKTSTVEALVWVLVYAGLLLAGLGLFLRRADSPLGWVLLATGAVLALAGAVLIYVRSRMGP